MSEQQIWDQIKADLQKELPGKLFRSALNTAVLESMTAQGKKYFRLKVPSAFHRDILKKHFSRIQSQMQFQGKALKQIDILHPNRSLPLRSQTPKPLKYKKPARPAPNSAFLKKWTFSSFISGPQNCFAFSLAKNVAQNPGNSNTNPLFIYGPSGLGKTHLLHAIGNSMEQQRKKGKVLYLPAERFFNDCIQHIRNNNMPAFRQKYRQNIDVLLLDDIQILGRGESIQEEFFHTFENLQRSSRQIVLVSDQKPQDIKGLKERIKTRFEGGVVANVQMPDKDTQKAIIKSKAETGRLPLTEELICHIADIHRGSIRELEGHLNKIKMFCELQNKTPSLPLVQKLFSGQKEPVEPTPENFFSSFPAEREIKKIQKIVCAHFNLKTRDLKSPSRLQRLVPGQKHSSAHKPQRA